MKEYADLRLKLTHLRQAYGSQGSALVKMTAERDALIARLAAAEKKIAELQSALLWAAEEAL